MLLRTYFPSLLKYSNVSVHTYRSVCYKGTRSLWGNVSRERGPVVVWFREIFDTISRNSSCTGYWLRWNLLYFSRNSPGFRVGPLSCWDLAIVDRWNKRVVQNLENLTLSGRQWLLSILIREIWKMLDRLILKHKCLCLQQAKDRNCLFFFSVSC